MQKKSISTTQKKEFYMQKKRFYLFEKVKKRKEKYFYPPLKSDVYFSFSF